MNEWDSICTVDRYLTRACPDHVRLILLEQLFGLLVVLKVRENAGKDTVKL